jgi:hypothetical protein
MSRSICREAVIAGPANYLDSHMSRIYSRLLAYYCIVVVVVDVDSTLLSKILVPL